MSGPFFFSKWGHGSLVLGNTLLDIGLLFEPLNTILVTVLRYHLLKQAYSAKTKSICLRQVIGNTDSSVNSLHAG